MGDPAPEIVVFESHEGGKIYEISPGGEHRIWGTVLEYQAGLHVSFSWHPGLEEAQATTVSVDFEPTDDGATVVTLVHTGWEAPGDWATAVRENYVTGWAYIIQTALPRSPPRTGHSRFHNLATPTNMGTGVGHQCPIPSCEIGRLALSRWQRLSRRRQYAADIVQSCPRTSERAFLPARHTRLHLPRYGAGSAAGLQHWAR